MAKKTINIIYKVEDKQLLKLKNTLASSEKEANELSKKLNKTGTSAKKAGEEGSNSFLNFKNVVSLISFAAITAGLTALIKNMVTIRGEFQKFEAVLTNTLGSNSKAQAALNQISKFASQTPFSVQELTASFVKLANQGFVPTEKELRSLGDLAASTGKEFIMLTEAIIDAQVGEFERLKEFGIRASKEGEKVTFTFKGVKTQVDFTTDSIRDYILGLGDAEGVSGAMVKISETLAGQISNTGDNFDTFFNQLGRYNEGPIGEFFKLFNTAMGEINSALATANLTAQELAEIPLEKFRKSYSAAKQEVEDNGSFKLLNTLYQDLTIAINSVNEDLSKNKNILESLIEVRRFAKEEGISEAEALELLTLKQEIYTAELTGYKEIRKDLDKDVKDYNIKLDEQKKKTDAAAAAERQLMLEMMARQAALKKGEPLKLPTGFPTLAELNAEAILNAKFNKIIKEDRIKSAKETKKAIQKIKDEEINEEIARQKEILALSEGLAFSLFDLATNTRNNDIEKIQDYYDKQIELAGDNDRAKKELEMKRDREVEAARAKEIEKEKKAAKIRIAIEGLIAIAKIFAQYKWPAGIIPAAIMAGITASNIAQVDKYKDGGWIKGPGNETSDSVPIMASKNEFMVNAAAAKNSPRLLELINDKKLSDKVLFGASRNGGFSDSRIVNRLLSLEAKLDSLRPPDLVEQNGIAYKVYRKGESYRKLVRAKSF